MNITVSEQAVAFQLDEAIEARPGPRVAHSIATSVIRVVSSTLRLARYVSPFTLDSVTALSQPLVSPKVYPFSENPTAEERVRNEKIDIVRRQNS